MYLERQELKEKAIEYVKKTKFPDATGIYINITASDRENDIANYKQDLEIFKALFNANDEDIKTALWNIAVDFPEDAEYVKEDFTIEEYDFIMQAIKAWTLSTNSNVNPPIVTKRLVLRAIKKDDFELFCHYFKKDGDFVALTGRAPTSEDICLYANRIEPLFFTVEEKLSHNVVGCVGLNIHNEYNTSFIEYYVFKKYRNKGYAKEAITSLTKKALKNKLFLPVETLREYVYLSEPVKISAVRARIATNNEPSQKTIQSCGFLHEATMHKTMHIYRKGWVDENVYYITKSQLVSAKEQKK